MKEKTIYPLVKVEFNTLPDSFQLKLTTDVRMEYQGMYYFWNVNKEIVEKEFTEKSLIDHINHFHIEIYKIIRLGKVDLNMIHSGTNTPVFELDPDRRSERERLMLNTKY